ncbi:MAG: aminotransferase class V-fold PLP-dependent enzyme [Anaerolineaceae bacterium]|nr:aminotransferase class V-fold PLP-dependent enzyme [Anaerolineaceae bacterium]
MDQISEQTSNLQQAKTDFLSRYPDFQHTMKIDDLRQTDYPLLDETKHVYLDYTGSGLYARSQLANHHAILQEHVFGNPHSSNPSSSAMTDMVKQARAYVLSYFNAASDEYVCIFTSNASGALKLIGEAYPFTGDSKYLLAFDNHNSVNGIREYARKKNAAVQYLPVTPPEMRMNEIKLLAALAEKPVGQSLFAFPAQSNFSGVQHPLDWIEKAHALGWDVLLDAAAFVPTNKLDLSVVKPDFVALSFYKMFGYPTGVGALIARRSALANLNRPWFAGGTITVASVQGDTYFLREGAEGFEDGTLNFLMLPAVEMGLRHLQSIGIDGIHKRVYSLTGWLLDSFSKIKHSNGNPLIKIYGPTDSHMRGGTITFNLFDQIGHFIDHVFVEQQANKMNISLRSGCFCNPGGGELALGLSADELTSCFAVQQRMEYDDFRRCIDDKSTGAVRVSVGLVSNFEDVFTVIEFIRKFVDFAG